MRKGELRHVVDANVAADATERSAYRARSCREYLEALRQHRHRLAMSAALSDEWRRHCSLWTTTWLRAMFQQDRVDWVNAASLASLTDAVEDLVKAHPDRAGAPHLKQRILKDRHLLELALASDQRVASLDEKARRDFHGLAERFPPLREIVWVNPCHEADGGVAWLEAGAPAESHRCLGSDAG